MKRILRYGKCFALSKIQIQFGQRPFHIAIRRAISRAKAGLAVQQENAVTNGALSSSNPQGHGQKTLLCVQTHAQALAHPGRGRANGVLALLLLAVSISISLQAYPHSRQIIAADSITPLQIGDAIPEELWDMPLPIWSAANNSVQTSKLGDYRGKTIILDFWATWCTACIASFPDLHKLADQYHEDLVVMPVTYQRAVDVNSFYTKSPMQKKIGESFKTIIEATLNTYFPRKTIPHTVVIDGKGMVHAITSPLYLKAETIANLITGAQPYIPLKRELHLKKALLKHAYDDVITHGKLYYTAITGPTDGFVSAGDLASDTLKGTKRYYTTGQPILQLYAATLLYTTHATLVFTPNRRILAVDTPGNFLAHTTPDGASTLNSLEWRNTNTYNYESIFPITVSEAEMREKMRLDLDFHFGLKSGIEKRRMKCLILSEAPWNRAPFRSNDSTKSMLVINQYSYSKNAANRRHIGKSENGAINYMRNGTVSGLIAILNGRSPASGYFCMLPPVINEVQYTGRINLDLPDDLTDLDALKRTLLAQGLILEEEYRNIDMFVLAYPSTSIPTEELKLTPLGYVR
ncbi:TlpA family protein disulfide reductase [Parapedobacter sp. ISTM3]|uniref:TlpA family protein disulfide reductase n=1 Tax=Parapedobacter sp. ISTM3 TaxID=2800130 RepID=UPI001903C688|nr:TlpA disulfide reductase family protein [Parapedobacter sp. ISTM3]MBK1442669.1 TlpA family protein disulfide reductase [Parapedobacter sp. ISTM3]